MVRTCVDQWTYVKWVRIHWDTNLASLVDGISMVRRHIVTDILFLLTMANYPILCSKSKRSTASPRRFTHNMCT